MRKFLLGTLLMFICASVFSQENSERPYLVGHPDFKEFPPQVKIHTGVDPLVELDNGKHCSPALNRYLKYSEEYVGGMLINTINGDTTIINKIAFSCQNDENCFWVYGDDFNNNFNLENGYILYDGEIESVFYNKDTGEVFSIHKPTK